MDVPEARARLAASAATIATAVADVDPEEARFHPRAQAWSILEILGHLVAEEREDFRARFESTLRDPGAPWPPLDPEERVRTSAFDERTLPSLLAEFADARRDTLTYLDGLTDPDLNARFEHPRGALTAGDLLSSWVAHDLLHVRQIVANRYAFWKARSAPYEPGYAGRW